MDDIVLNKVASIERCLFRIAEEYEDTPANLQHDLTHHDSIVRAIIERNLDDLRAFARHALGVGAD